MESPYSPPIVCLTDDDDDNELETHVSTFNSEPFIYEYNHFHRKRKLSDANVRVNSSIVNWSKRPRYDPYHQINPPYNATNYESASGTLHSNDYLYSGPESHSFSAFDWSSGTQSTASRAYTNFIHTPSRPSYESPPPITPIHVTKHILDHSDSTSLLPVIHQQDGYAHPFPRRFKSTPLSCRSPPPLPLPLPTSTVIRPTAQRIQPGKAILTSYLHHRSPSPPPSLPLSRHHQAELVFQSRSRPPSPSASLGTPTAAHEIRRQPLNGSGLLSAFYDSECYRCNICKFKSVSSSIILQHIFTHMFFCSHCSYYTHSHHSLYQHVYEKHQTNLYHDKADPKDIDLLYVVQCSDGKFALCMDTSTPPVPLSSQFPSVSQVPKPNEPGPSKSKVPPSKRRAPRKKLVKKKNEDDDIVVLSENVKTNSEPHISTARTPGTASTMIKVLPRKKKPTPTYVLMKHRRCYSIRYPPCLHSLTLEYNICREHTIRQMCHTQGPLKRNGFHSKSTPLSIIEAVAKCLKATVNAIIVTEENEESPNLVCALPHTSISSIISAENFDVIIKSLKITNKHDLYAKQNDRYKAEYSIRMGNRHHFILSSAGITKTDQSIFASLHSSITSDDSPYTRTNLDNFIMLNDNTDRFLATRRPLSSKLTKKTDNGPKLSTNNPRPNMPAVSNPLQQMNFAAKVSQVDRNNNLITSSESKTSSAVDVICID
ncbi:unnamed protein product [Adineta ricciae]|uniref:C2H2-type domain-containing protein n=1 Tax=Adineta ricciae TaxID=249248 RepID=A0A814NGN5_ADIRI|nr:unnamed protein product [Adineta ricciae]CAF1091325.1 unnamed protein product [Adineta ricciae]